MAEQTTVFANGVVFTADAAGSWAGGLAVRGDRIVTVGGQAEIEAAKAGADEVIDLAGRLVVPGFVDAHVHPIVGGLERIRCDLTGGNSVQDYLDLIGTWAGDHDDAWVRGGGWSMAAFPDGLPTRELLDAVVGERLAYLPNRDHHSAWVSSAALRLAGIDARTPDLADGRIERDANGEPTGILHEGAMGLVQRLAPPDTPNELAAGLRAAQAYLHSLGITGWQDAMIFTDDDATSGHQTYLRAQRDGWLTARVAGAFWWDRSYAASAGIAHHVGRLARLRAEADQAGGRYAPRHVKVMADGVVETFTAALLEPYLDGHGRRGGNHGISFFEPAQLVEIVAALDAADFGVHFHALGDRAVRDVLDAVAATMTEIGIAGRRHHAAHLQVVDPADIRRFRALGVAANLQAVWAAHEPQLDELAVPFLGEPRASGQYPFGDLHRDGATLVMGSDWPVSTPDPFAALHVAVNRIAPEAPAGTPPLGTRQELPLAAALRAYTAGSAHICHFDSSGVIAPGRQADLVVCDRNPFADPTDRIADTRVQATYVAGRLVSHTA